jgi:hypothetical protein
MAMTWCPHNRDVARCEACDQELLRALRAQLAIARTAAREAFACCGGSDEDPPEHCLDCHLLDDVRANARADALEEAARVVEEKVSGCSCHFAPCEHDDLRKFTAAAIRALKGTT